MDHHIDREFDWGWSQEECSIQVDDSLKCRRECPDCQGQQFWLAVFREWKCDQCGRVD